MQTFTVNGTELKVSARLTNSGVRFPFAGKDDKTLHNEFSVTISTSAGRTSFKFYGSQQEYQSGIDTLEGNNLKHALYCFVSDAASGDQSFENFCSELGYDEDSRTAERTYKACRKSLEQWNRITNSADVYEACNALND